MHQNMTDLRVHTCKMNSYSSFHPTINLSVDFSHSLSLGRTKPRLDLRTRPRFGGVFANHATCGASTAVVRQAGPNVLMVWTTTGCISFIN
jgi:hypothetical protein